MAKEEVSQYLTYYDNHYATLSRSDGKRAMESRSPCRDSRSGGRCLSAGHALRLRCRSQSFTSHTAGAAPGVAQCNLVVLPKKYALDFMLFCQRNPKPCPLLEVTDPGSAVPDEWLAQDADLRTDLPLYRVYREGILVEEVKDITTLWNDDMVAFLLGCSFSFESALEAAGLGLRHNEEGKNVPMFKTNIPCRPAGIFRGNMVVSMRPYPGHQVAKAAEVTARYPKVHGGPVHIGTPSVIGIADLSRPDYGEAVSLREGELPVFWACGVTPQNVILESRPDIAITHAPGCMFVTDIANESLSLS